MFTKEKIKQDIRDYCSYVDEKTGSYIYIDSYISSITDFLEIYNLTVINQVGSNIRYYNKENLEVFFEKNTNFLLFEYTLIYEYFIKYNGYDHNNNPIDLNKVNDLFKNIIKNNLDKLFSLKINKGNRGELSFEINNPVDLIDYEIIIRDEDGFKKEIVLIDLENYVKNIENYCKVINFNIN